MEDNDHMTDAHQNSLNINLDFLLLPGRHHGVSRSFELGKFSPPKHGKRSGSSALQRTSPDTWVFVS